MVTYRAECKEGRDLRASLSQPALPGSAFLGRQLLSGLGGPGFGAEQFVLQAFVDMISNEVEQLCQVCRSDTETADLIKTTSSKTVSPTELAAFYAPPQARHGG